MDIASELSFIIKNSKSIDRIEEILTDDALEFIYKLEIKFRNQRKLLLQERIKKQQLIDEGKLPDFLIETENIRKENWKVREVPKDLQDRRVEITGPVDRKMIINALNSGVKVFMADFEDSNSPTWSNIINGQLNLFDANNKSITYTNPINQKFLNSPVFFLKYLPLLYPSMN